MDVRSPLLTETLKSQLTTIEKQLTTAKQTLEKNKNKKMLEPILPKSPYTQTQRRSHNEMVGGAKLW